MDKWKESELAKMKAGGNRNARVFFESQDDWNDSSPISQKYQSRACALYKDKIMVESQGTITQFNQCYFATFSSFQKLMFKHLKNEIRQDQEFAANVHVLFIFFLQKKEGKFKLD